MSKQFIGIIVAVVLGLGAIFWFNSDRSTKTTSENGGTQISGHAKGEGQKNITLTEYGDFQCPACASYYPVVKSVVEKYQKDITFRFRNFPLVQIHPNAFAASRAAEAAGLQGKFWEMHDLLYEQQTTWASAGNPQSYFQSFASHLNLDINKFNQDYASSAVNDIINGDLAEAKKVGADSTPTFVLDGKKLDQNPEDQAAFEQLIEDAISAKQ